MRVLVTNTRSPQAYAIIRCLRPVAEHIVACVSSRKRLGLVPTSHAAYSRLVDQRYDITDPGRDWSAGQVGPLNSADEAAFIDQLLEICARERIDAVFPSTDPWVYVLAKNQSAFAARGIVIPLPDYETVAIPLDKWATIKLARQAGFPCPETVLGESDDLVREFGESHPPPWMIKLRFTTGGQGLSLVENIEDLVSRARSIRDRHGAPLVQDYIPGPNSRNFHLMMDRDGQVLSAVSPDILRRNFQIFRSMSVACRSAPLPEWGEEVIGLVRQLRWWGGVTIQTKIDPRDGRPKLMEINPRLGVHLWYRTELGLNEPVMSLQLARGEALPPVPPVPNGHLLLKPIEDLVGLPFEMLDRIAFDLRRISPGGQIVDPSNPPVTWSALLGATAKHYLSRAPKRYSPQSRHLFDDPLPGVLWAIETLASYSGQILAGKFGR